MEKIPDVNVYVRFCETDAGGHVSNVSYFIYLEEARSKFFQAVGFTGKEKRGSIDFIVASTSCDFLVQAYAGQTLAIATKVERIGTKSFKLAHEVIDNKTGNRIALGWATIVCFDYQKQQTEKVPPMLRELLEDFLLTA